MARWRSPLHTVFNPIKDKILDVEVTKNLHLTCVQGKTPYPKIFLFSEEQVSPMFLRILGTGATQFTLSISISEYIGRVKKLPDGWEATNAADDLMSAFMKAVVIRTFEAEIRLMQEIVIDLAAEQWLDPNTVARDFDKVTKLVALSTSNERHESALAKTRAIHLSRRIIGNATARED